MQLFKFYRTLRKPCTTNLAGLVVFKRLTEQLGLFEGLSRPEFLKLHGHSLQAIFFAMLTKSLMGAATLTDFEKTVQDEVYLRKLAGFMRKVGKTVLGRNLKRFNSVFLRTSYENLILRLVKQQIISLRAIAIDSTFLEVTGKKYEKMGIGWGKNGVKMGYRLSVAFDLDSKLPVAYILTYGSTHDSQFFLPLVKMIESTYSTLPEQLVMDRGYYNQDFMTYLTEKGIEFEIPGKKFTSIKERFHQCQFTDFHSDSQLNLSYSEEYLQLPRYGLIRVIWIVGQQKEEWIPRNLKTGDWWCLFTNRQDISSVEVIKAYKRRWEIEVFFRGLRQRMALGSLPGRDFRQIQAHVFFVFVGYILLMLVRRFQIVNNLERRINLKYIQITTLFIQGYYQEKGSRLILHLTEKNWLFYYLAEK